MNHADHGTHEEDSKTHAAAEHAEHAHPIRPRAEKRGVSRHLGHSVADFRKRFWVSLAVTIPILILSPSIQEFIGLRRAISFLGDQYLLFVLASFVYFYGGSPFLKGIAIELMARLLGMMTLIAVAITSAYLYSGAVVFGLRGGVLFWELATLLISCSWVTGSRCAQLWGHRGRSRILHV